MMKASRTVEHARDEVKFLAPDHIAVVQIYDAISVEERRTT